MRVPESNVRNFKIEDSKGDCTFCAILPDSRLALTNNNQNFQEALMTFIECIENQSGSSKDVVDDESSGGFWDS